MKMGVMANVNQNLDEDTVVLLAEEMGLQVAVGRGARRKLRRGGNRSLRGQGRRSEAESSDHHSYGSR